MAPMIDTLLAELEHRRRELRMPYRALARRSGVGLRTVHRVLSRDTSNLNLRTLTAIADALGADVGLVRRRGIRAIQRRHAKAKAKRLAAIAQGTAALEGQAVSPDAMADLAQDIEKKLLVGPKIRLWSEP